jgi:hypothetical protein
MDNILNISDMRRWKFHSILKPKSKTPPHHTNAPTKFTSDLDQLKILMDLRKTSHFFKLALKTLI